MTTRSVTYKYFICATNEVEFWKSRGYKRISSSLWEEVDEKTAKECFKTKKYTTEVWPDNDDYHCTYTFDVKVKKETLTTEIFE